MSYQPPIAEYRPTTDLEVSQLITHPVPNKLMTLILHAHELKVTDDDIAKIMAESFPDTNPWRMLVELYRIRYERGQLCLPPPQVQFYPYIPGCPPPCPLPFTLSYRLHLLSREEPPPK